MGNKIYKELKEQTGGCLASYLNLMQTFLSGFFSFRICLLLLLSLSSIPSVKRMTACVQFEDEELGFDLES